MGFFGDAWQKIKDGSDIIAQGLTPAQADNTALNNAQARAYSTADRLGSERSTYRPPSAPMVQATSVEPRQAAGGGPPGGAAAGIGPPGSRPPAGRTAAQMMNGQSPLGRGPQVLGGVQQLAPPPSPLSDARSQQNAALDMIRSAALGQQPSAAEIAGRAAASRAAAQQFGQASALQGGLSPGAALRMASEGSQNILSQNANDMAALRAGEMERARGALVQGLGGLRGQEQDISTLDAQLRQQAALANQKAGLDQQTINQDWLKALLAGELQSQGQGVQSAVGLSDANARQAAADNAFKGTIISQGAGLLPLLSDEREKKDVKRANLDRLADSLKGFRYRYKDEKNGPGERVGIMAQDAIKGGPAGQQMVRLGGDGKLRMDPGNSIGAALAMSAEALRRSRGKVS